MWITACDLRHLNERFGLRFYDGALYDAQPNLASASGKPERLSASYSGVRAILEFDPETLKAITALVPDEITIPTGDGAGSPRQVGAWPEDEQ